MSCRGGHGHARGEDGSGVRLRAFRVPGEGGRMFTIRTCDRTPLRSSESVRTVPCEETGCASSKFAALRMKREAVKWRHDEPEDDSCVCDASAHAARLRAGITGAEPRDVPAEALHGNLRIRGVCSKLPRGVALLQLFSCHFIAGSEAGDAVTPSTTGANVSRSGGGKCRESRGPPANAGGKGQRCKRLAEVNAAGRPRDRVRHDVARAWAKVVLRRERRSGSGRSWPLAGRR